MLRCALCGHEVGGDALRCPKCGGPLQFDYFEGDIQRAPRVWDKFADFFPFKLEKKYSLGEGNTPLIYLRRLSHRLGVEIYAKYEAMNPTWSFKDRGTYLAIHYALLAGYRRVGTVSTGNMGASVAAYASLAGTDAIILTSRKVSQESLIGMELHGANVIVVDGDYGMLYHRALEIGAEKGIYFINSDNPYRVEGYKSISFEIADERDADYIFVPTSSGGLYRGIFKGYMEMRKCGFVERVPQIVCVQASGCSPIYTAYISGAGHVERYRNPHTVAHAIENPYPPSGDAVLKILRANKFPCVAVDDRAILEAQRELASEGLFVQPASASTLSALKQGISEGKIEENSRVVLILTGAGFRNIEHLDIKRRICKLENLERCVK